MCEQKGRDNYGRMVAVCRAGRTDLANAQVTSGLAIALPEFTPAYVEAEASAKAKGVGIWGSEFESPADFRADNQGAIQRIERRQLPQHQSSRPQQSYYFRSCNEARAAGVAPMYRGEPGYRSGLDGDNDGIACEPYRGQR